MTLIKYSLHYFHTPLPKKRIRHQNSCAFFIVSAASFQMCVNQQLLLILANAKATFHNDHVKSARTSRNKT
jgi:hypothetical protein